MNQGKKPEHKTKRRSLPLLKRLIVWAFWIVLLWWITSAVVPTIPSPVFAGKKLLSLVMDLGDVVYYSVKEEQLEESARKVRESAMVLDSNANKHFEDSISGERMKRMPILSEVDDSMVRSRLQSVSKAPPIRGRILNIVIIGIDSRLGVRDARADAIHLVTINPESAIVEIMSIPRDTYCDLGFPDTTTFNIVANARALGRKGFMGKIREVAQRGPINYYIEVGFSQAMGVLEVLGYKNPVSTLQFLRTRKTLPGGDLQRAHNQARFIADNLDSKFHLLTGPTGDLFLSAGLQFITTNLTKEICLGLIYNLHKNNFPEHRDDAIRLRLLSPTRIRLKEMPTDSATVESTLAKVRAKMGENGEGKMDLATRMRRINTLAIADSNRSHKVVHRLSRIHQQRGWLQIQDITARNGIRDTLIMLLSRAYKKLGKTDEIEKLEESRKAENFLLNQNR